MKKLFALLLAMLMVLSLVACGSKPAEDNGAPAEEEKKLVVYTAASDEQLDVIIPLYEEKYVVELDQEYINEHNPELIEKCKDIQTTVGF